MDGVCLLKGLNTQVTGEANRFIITTGCVFFLTLIFVAFFNSEESVALVWIVSGILLAVASGCSRYNVCLGIGS